MRTTIDQITLGRDVYGSDGDKIGHVSSVESNYFVIEKGFLFPSDVYIPTSAASSVDADGNVHLSMTKDEIESQDWSSPPVWSDHDGDTYSDTDRDVIERAEERLTVDKDTQQAGTVRVGKRVVEEEQSVDVPVTREEVTMERRAVDRPASDASLSEADIEVPVYEERVTTGKEARVVEELELGKTRHTDTERVTDTVRREEFDVDADDETLKR